MRLPHISGVPMSMGEKKVTFEGADPVTLKKGDTVSLDPKNGRIFKGAIDVITTVSDVASLIDWLLTHETSSSNGSGSRGQGGGGNLNTGTEQLATLEAIEADDDMSVAPEILEAAPLAPNLLPFASMPLLTGAPVLPVMNFARF
ncbi:MAG: hypothetical protein ACD_73C00152G0001 [uncultured bacterium]|nr:MAG: hypothetical protein ACD_73C00152G0001 [uncultured bacterium]